MQWPPPKSTRGRVCRMRVPSNPRGVCATAIPARALQGRSDGRRAGSNSVVTTSHSQRRILARRRAVKRRSRFGRRPRRLPDTGQHHDTHREAAGGTREHRGWDNTAVYARNLLIVGCAQLIPAGASERGIGPIVTGSRKKMVMVLCTLLNERCTLVLDRNDGRPPPCRAGRTPERARCHYDTLVDLHVVVMCIGVCHNPRRVTCVLHPNELCRLKSIYEWLTLFGFVAG